MGGMVGTKGGPRSDINITPLVDVVLVLLIIFMVLTPLMEKEMGVKVPDDIVDPTPPPPPDQIPDQFVLRVKDDGRMFVNAEAMTDATVVDRLKMYYRLAKSKQDKQGPPVIFFDADDKTKYGAAIKALDAIKESSKESSVGWTIGMMTEKIKGEEGGAAPAPGATPDAPATPGTAPAPPTPAAPPQ